MLQHLHNQKTVGTLLRFQKLHDINRLWRGLRYVALVVLLIPCDIVLDPFHSDPILNIILVLVAHLLRVLRLERQVREMLGHDILEPLLFLPLVQLFVLVQSDCSVPDLLLKHSELVHPDVRMAHVNAVVYYLGEIPGNVELRRPHYVVCD